MSDEQMSAAMTHIEGCASCTADWAAAEQKIGGLLSAGRADAHLSDADLDTLAAYQGGSVDDEQRRLWAHVLVCRDCHAMVAALRGPSGEVSVVDPSPQKVWQEIQTQIALALVVSWVGAALHLRRARGLKVLPPRPPVRGRSGTVSQPIDLAWSLKGYELWVSMEPDESIDPRSRLRVKLTPADPHVRVAVSRGGRVLHDLPVSSDGVVKLPALSPGEYELMLSRSEVEVIGRVSISIEPDLVSQLRAVNNTPLYMPASFAGGNEELALVASDREMLRYRSAELRTGVSIAFVSDLMPLENVDVGVTWQSSAGDVVRRSAPLRPSRGRLEAYIEAIPHDASPRFWMAPPPAREGAPPNDAR